MPTSDVRKSPLHFNHLSGQVGMAPTLADQFEALWESSDSTPDVFAFLDQHGESDVEEHLIVLLANTNRC